MVSISITCGIDAPLANSNISDQLLKTPFPERIKSVDSAAKEVTYSPNTDRQNTCLKFFPICHCRWCGFPFASGGGWSLVWHAWLKQISPGEATEDLVSCSRLQDVVLNLGSYVRHLELNRSPILVIWTCAGIRMMCGPTTSINKSWSWSPKYTLWLILLCSA